jgi:chromosome segregation ATPase
MLTRLKAKKRGIDIEEYYEELQEFSDKIKKLKTQNTYFRNQLIGMMQNNISNIGVDINNLSNDIIDINKNVTELQTKLDDTTTEKNTAWKAYFRMKKERDKNLSDKKIAWKAYFRVKEERDKIRKFTVKPKNPKKKNRFRTT